MRSRKTEWMGILKTILAAFNQKEFVDAIDYAIVRVLTKSGSGDFKGVLLAGGCHSGFHRADVWRRAITEDLKELRGISGHRLFNAQSLTIADASKREGMEILKIATQWCYEPW